MTQGECQFPPEPLWLRWANKVLRRLFGIRIDMGIQVSTGKIVTLSLSKHRPNYSKDLDLIWTRTKTEGDEAYFRDAMNQLVVRTMAQSKAVARVIKDVIAECEEA